MRKARIYALLCVFVLCTTSLFSQIAFSEDFEIRPGYTGGTPPPGWTQEYDDAYETWDFMTGGHSANPETAANGTYNATFIVESHNNETTKLVSPFFDISYMSRPRLRFNLAMTTWWFGGVPYVDELRIYYRTSFIDEWKPVNQGVFVNAVEEWTEIELYLDSTDVSSTYYLAFEGKTGYGHGVCIDDIVVEEAGLLPLHVNNIEVDQASTSFIATGTDNNEILKYKVHVVGNDGTVTLESLDVQSLNTDDNDIDANGVKLFYTQTEVFSDQNQIGTNIDFVAGNASFSGLNFNLGFGYHYFWVTYDISPDAEHGNSFDAQANTGSIVINGETYPDADISPAGTRSIFETLLMDGFETDMGWTFGEGFSIDTPQARGGWDGGHPKPDAAARGVHVLGTNLDGGDNEWDFDYPADLTDRQYYAISPEINCYFYKDVYLSYSRWLNLEVWDQAYIDISVDTGATWTKIWGSDTRYFTDNNWETEQIDISTFADRNASVMFRFGLGETNGDNEYSGWNIDNFILTGNFIDSDVGVTEWIEPTSGCGHTNAENVTVRVANYAGVPTSDTVAIAFSLDGGDTFYNDTIFGSIPVDGDTVFTFHITADMSVAGYYYPVAKTVVGDDEDIENDSYASNEIFAIPTFTMPFEEDFETSSHYWIVTGSATSDWELGIPRGDDISNAGSGYFAWVTDIDGHFSFNDSSFVMSPCFDFTRIDYPVFDFKTISVLESEISGAQLQYSLDEGVNWAVVPRLEDKWNWYDTLTSDILQSKFSSGEGWTDSIGEWVDSKHQLPYDVRNENRVRFRVAFASTDGTIPDDGFGFDNVKIYDAPVDMGVTAITSPVSACELTDAEQITIEITNFGLDTLELGQQIIVGVDYDEELLDIDTFLLSADVLPGGTFTHTFDSTLDLSHAGDHQIMAYTMVPEDINFFDVLNDTLIDSVSVYGMPDYDLGSDFGVMDYTGGIQIDGKQDFGIDFVAYLWDDGSTTSTDRYLTITGPGMYYITVTNDSSCVANDSIYSYLSAQDIAVTDLYDLASACSLPSDYLISVEIKNLFTDSIYTDDEVYVGYRINGDPVVLEPIGITSSFAPGDSLDFTFTTPIDMSESGVYDLKVFTSFDKDFDFTNDTLDLAFPIVNWGQTSVDIGDDTLFTKEAAGIELTATNPNPWNPYSSILWSDGSGLSTFTIPTDRSGKYWVDVDDSYGCGTASDTVVIVAYDISIYQVNFPDDTCEASATETIRFSLANTGPDTLEIGTEIPVEYVVDGVIQNETLVIDQRFYPDSSLNFTSGVTYDMHEETTHFFRLTTNFAQDIFASNNSTNYAFNVWGYPALDLGEDTIYSLNTDTISFDATATSTSTYLWDDGSSTYTTPVYTIINRPNTSLYKVTVTDRGCSTSDSVLVWTKDLSMESINKSTSYCELTNTEQIEVTIRNNGVDMYNAGEQLILGLQVNEELVYDTVILSTPIFGMNTYNYTFDSTFDMSAVGEYNISAFMVEDLKNIDAENDSIGLETVVYGYPEPDLHFDTITTSQPDTIELRVASNFTSYLWQDGHNSNIYTINDNIPGWYSVTVTWGPACPGSDSVRIISWDVYPTTTEPQSVYCEGDTSQTVTIRIWNNSIDMLDSGSVFSAGYLFNGDTIIENFIMTEDVAPTENFTYSFTQGIDISEATTHNLQVWTQFAEDADLSNDTVSSYSFTVKGVPAVDLGVDTILSLNPVGIELAPAGSFIYYEWSDPTATPNDTLVISRDYSQVYSVTVYDTDGCMNSDSVIVFTSDISVDSIISPQRQCDFSNAEEFQMSMKNNALDTLPLGTQLFVTIKLNDTISVSDTIATTELWYPDSILTYQADSTFDLSVDDTNSFDVSIYLDRDCNSNNDSLSMEIAEFVIPSPNLPDTVNTTQPDTVMLYSENSYDQYLWSSGTFNDTLFITANESRTYYLTVQDVNGCETTDSTLILSNDVAYYQFLSPVSNCALDTTEQVRFSIINRGADAIVTGTEIICSLEMDSILIESKSIILNQDLSQDDILEIVFDTILDLSSSDSAFFKTYFSLANEHSRGNDTSTTSIYAWGYPEFDLGEDIISYQPDTILFELPEGYDTYIWQDGTDTNTYALPHGKSAHYAVTVSNTHSCTSADEIFIVTNSLSIDSVVLPQTACQLSSEEVLQFMITDNGADSIFPTDIIMLSITINDTIGYTENIQLTDTLLPDSSTYITSANTLDFSIPGEYSIALELELNIVDTIMSLDSSSFSVTHLTLPTIEINNGADTIRSLPPFALSVPSGYDSYIWNGMDSTNEFTVSESGMYYVTVTSGEGCSSYDSVYVLGFDFEISAITSPIDEMCSAEVLNSVVFELYNNSSDTVFANDSIFIGYTIDAIYGIDTVALSENWNPADTLSIRLSESTNFTTAGSYNISLWIVESGDINYTNDSLSLSFNVYTSPTFVLDEQRFSITAPAPFTMSGPEGNYDYLWSNGETTREIQVSESDDYILTVTDENGCTGSNQLEYIVDTTRPQTDIISIITDAEISIFPNPADNILYVKIEDVSVNSTISLVAGDRKVIATQSTKENTKGVCEFDVSNLPEGVYYLYISNTFFTRIEKVIIR